MDNDLNRLVAFALSTANAMLITIPLYTTHRKGTITLKGTEVVPHPFNAAAIPSRYVVAFNWKARSTLLLSKR